ncbi:unnamed protein product [Rhizophagus irregularis]|uniref:Protein kinase domain-containing protein n=1 Tax=Rhizophagus irregularis TaxID=588596 RepID=A0A915Z0D6_9GLOM|nr:unnamed protein product [Rhizophagus irregularis]
MNELEDPEYDTICTQCNQKIINYLNKLCRRQFFPYAQVNKPQSIQKSKIIKLPKVKLAKLIKTKLIKAKLFKTKSKLPKNNLIDSKTSGNFKLDKFIEETQLNSKYCDDFIEWVPHSNLENIKYLTNGGNSKIYSGTWNLLLNMSLASNQLSSKVALKVINYSDNINDHILNELKIHHKCRNPRVIPFYGIAKAPVGNEYAMIIRHAEHGDLRNYILGEDDRIFISDFGLCQPIDFEIASNSIQGVLPYIAPEVLRCKPYTKQSEVYSLSMIMWELTSDKPPFSNKHHDAGLALEVLDELKPLRPKIIKGTPDFYVNIMEQCWSSDPLKRPDASLLPKLFEEMIGLCKVADDIASSKITLTSNSVNTGYSTRATDNLNMASTYYPKEENTVMINNNSVDIELSPQPNSVTSSNKSIIKPGAIIIV